MGCRKTRRFPLTRSRFPLPRLPLTTHSLLRTLRRSLAATPSRLTRRPERTSTRDRFRCALLGVCGVETELAGTLICTPLQVINPALPDIRRLFPLICGGVACVSCVFPLVGFDVTMIGDSFSHVRDPVAFVGGSLACIEQLLPLFELGSVIFEGLMGLSAVVLVPRLCILHVPSFGSHRLVVEGRRSWPAISSIDERAYLEH